MPQLPSSALAPLDPIATVLTVALGHQWVTEQGGDNHGQAVAAILASCGLAEGAPWCAAFVSYIGRLVLGASWPLPMDAGCAKLGSDAESRGLLRDSPARGAIFLLWSSKLNRYHHTGFISAERTPAPGVPLGAWSTVEGNTNPGGSPEGTGVFCRNRVFGPLDAFIWWWA